MNAGQPSMIEQHAVGCLGAALLNESLAIEDVSDGVVAVGGHPREALIGLGAVDLVHPDDLERAVEAMLELSRTQEPTVEGVYRMRFVDDTYHEFAVQGLIAEDNGTAKTIMRFSAVSDALRSEEFARDTVDALRMLSESRDVDACFARIHRLTERHLPGTELTISTMHGATMCIHQRLADRSTQTTHAAAVVPSSVERALAFHREGPWRAFHRMAEFEIVDDAARITSVLTDEADELLGFVEATRACTSELTPHEWMVHGLVRQLLTTLLRRLKLDEQLRHAADHDPLTGLANRRKLFRDMDASTDLAGSTLLLIDLDDFSSINNCLGHLVGDQVLAALARRLSELCPVDATIARFGGDEFVVWAADTTIDLAYVEKGLQASVLGPAEGGQGTSLRCSIGAVTIQANEHPTDAVKRADEAMYVAKNAGGNSLHRA